MFTPEELQVLLDSVNAVIDNVSDDREEGTELAPFLAIRVKLEEVVAPKTQFRFITDEGMEDIVVSTSVEDRVHMSVLLETYRKEMSEAEYPLGFTDWVTTNMGFYCVTVEDEDIEVPVGNVLDFYTGQPA